MKTKYLYILLAFITLIIVLFGISMAGLINESSKCTNNPFTYGASRIIDEKGEVVNTFCSCSINGKPTFYFDKDEVYDRNPLEEIATLENYGQWKLNLSNSS